MGAHVSKYEDTATDQSPWARSVQLGSARK
jgi:hypothetical protein